MAEVSYTFTPEELAQIDQHIAKYPDKQSAVMPALWIAQEKFGWLSNEAIKLVADTLELPYSHVYGVTTFYTMYFKKQVPKHLIEVCTCFSCHEIGGPEMLAYVKEKIEADENGFGKDGKIWARAAECLGACDTAPICQITNRRYRHHLTKEKIDALIEQLNKDEDLTYERIPLYDQSVTD